MRQKRWLELVKDYDYEILYHPGNANKVANSLSRKSTTTVMSIQSLPQYLQNDINSPSLEILVGQLSTLTLESIFLELKEFRNSIQPLPGFKKRFKKERD